MKKILSLALALTFVLFTFAACGGNTAKTYSFDVSELAKLLSEKGKFVDALAEVDADVVSTAYGFSSAKNVKVYASGGATPEEVIVAEYEGEAAAKTGMDEFNKRVSAQKTTYSTYNPQYRPLLDDLLLKQVGKYVIYCVSSDNTAITAEFETFLESHIA